MKNIKPVDAIKHAKDKRVSIPTTELAGEEAAIVADDPKTAKYQQFKHEFTRGRDPELYWLNKYSNDDEETQSPDLKVDIRSLYVHEDVQPEMLINRLYKMREEKSSGMQDQMDLFASDELKTVVEDELERVADYYHHHSDWKNRLIQGDSLLVMNSLLKREGMAGKVQMVYIDPPYGIKYGSNWQMKLNSRDVKEGDESLSGEPEMIKAYRDTWEYGIHSYLSYLRDRFILARELLNETGSIFIQISDENVHLVRNVLDEIFGSENFISQIVYKKGGTASSDKISNVCDFILWYAKNIEQTKYRQLFQTKVLGEGESTGERYDQLESPSGERRPMTKEEKQDPGLIPHGWRAYKLSNPCSQHDNPKHRLEPLIFDGKPYFPPADRQWSVPPSKMYRLIEKNRIVSTGKNLAYVMYIDDYPVVPINNIWTDFLLRTAKLYVVQTSELAIQSCMLMCTDPGDLVLDPTCGGGTTAFVAEQWGRRWITIDTSRVALNVAKKRLSMARYPYYELFDKEGNDIRQGFIYKQVPHITLKSLANNEEPEMETLYDQPKEDKSKIRVSGPFTVETLQSFNVMSPEEMDIRPDEAEENRIFQQRVFDHLMAAGIRNGDKSQKATFHNVEPVASPYLHAKGYYTDGNGNERLAYFHIGPKFGSVTKVAVTRAIQEFRPKSQTEGATWLVLLGFSFEDNINDKDYNFGTYSVTKVRMHDDLMQDGLLKKDKGAGSFITIGEPDIELVKDEENTCHVEIRGLDIYDPIKDDVRARSVEDIAYWEIDDNYDGQQFIVRSFHFCGGDKDEFDNWRKGLGNLAKASQKTKKSAESTLRLEFNDEIWETLYGFESASIPYESGRRIAVRVVSQFGEESTKVITI